MTEFIADISATNLAEIRRESSKRVNKFGSAHLRRIARDYVVFAANRGDLHSHSYIAVFLPHDMMEKVDAELANDPTLEWFNVDALWEVEDRRAKGAANSLVAREKRLIVESPPYFMLKYYPIDILRNFGAGGDDLANNYYLLHVRYSKQMVDWFDNLGATLMMALNLS